MIEYVLRVSVCHAGVILEGAGFARQSERPFGAMTIGDWITIGDIPGRTESRLTTGKVTRVSHTFSEEQGVFTHAIHVSVTAEDPTA